MWINIKNEQLSLSVETLGAELMSLRSADGVEYLWQGDSRYWVQRAPVLFPYIGRLTDNSYLLNNKKYPMGIHGFAAGSVFKLKELGGDYVVLELCSNEETLSQYPFAFVLEICYALVGNQLKTTYRIENHSESTMPFAIGGHPGFRAPLVERESFADYILEFSRCCLPDRVGFTQQVYLSGIDQPYPLEDGKRIHLKHSLFDDDAVILKNMDREVTLRSEKSNRGVTVTYPDMPYVGFWHRPNTDAGYVCIEPWSSLPSRQNVVEELTCKSDLIHLAAGKTYENTWMITAF